IAITKLKLVILLFFTGFASALIASTIYGFDLKAIGLISAAIIFSVMGSNATTAYIDRDMDIVMARTSRRPVPSGVISPARNALTFGLVLVLAGIALSALTGWLAAVFVTLGFLDSAIIYNAISKKRTPLNILFGAPAGGMPVLAAWAAISKTKVDLLAVIMFLLVIIWTPMHIWSLAYFYKEDYKKASVPMLPVIWNSKKVFVLLGVLNFMLVFLSVFIGFFFNLSLLYISISILSGLAIIIISILLVLKNTKSMAWILFKLSSPYLAVIFLLLIIEYLWI
ncbi:MAG TPA: heme o synthase, partial [Candidatus Humimicrobiaceae bacterium]